MRDILRQVATAIDLDGYGASKNFVGFFEKKGRYKDGIAQSATAFFLGFFKELFDQLILVSSLHANLDEVGSYGEPTEDERDVALVQKLAAANLLRTLSYRKEFGEDFESNIYRQSIAAIWDSLEVLSVGSYSDLENIILAKMIVYGLHGHLFLISEKLGLAFYPHDDMGFGVIALDNSADLVTAKKFLAQADRLDGFCSVIEE